MELELIEDIISSDTYLLEPNKNWKKDFIFWLSLYLKEKCQTQSTRLVNDNNKKRIDALALKIRNAKTIKGIKTNINKLERLKFKAPQVYLNNLEPLYNLLEEKEASTLKNITENTLIYLFSKKMENLSVATKRNRLTIILNFISFIEEYNIGSGDGGYLFNINRKKINKQIQKESKEIVVLSPDIEYPKFLAAIDEIDFKEYSHRNKLMLKFLLLTGMRISELTELKNADVTLVKVSRTTYIQFKIIGKGNKHRTCKVVLNDVKKEYTLYTKSKSSTTNEFFFKSDNNKQMYREYVARLVKKVLTHAAITTTKNSPHLLRHSFACYAYYSADVKLDELKNLLGHEDIKTTQIYLHYFDSLVSHTAKKLSKSIKKKK